MKGYSEPKAVIRCYMRNCVASSKEQTIKNALIRGSLGDRYADNSERYNSFGDADLSSAVEPHWSR